MIKKQQTYICCVDSPNVIESPRPRVNAPRDALALCLTVRPTYRGDLGMIT